MKTLSSKLLKRWKGPYIVMKQLSKVTYRIIKEGKTQDVHIERSRDAVNHKNETIEDYDYDLALADAELQSIKQTQEALMNREAVLKEEKSKVQAEREVETVTVTNSHLVCLVVRPC